MSSLNVYLTFNGNCREAMFFYKKCLGGKLSFQTIGQSPLAGKMPAQMKNYILHATLTKGEFVLMASDMVGESGLVNGNSVSLMLNCSSEKELRNVYEKLSDEGTREHKIETTFFNGLLGGLTDKFGNHWLLFYQKQTTKNNNR